MTTIRSLFRVPSLSHMPVLCYLDFARKLENPERNSEIERATFLLLTSAPPASLPFVNKILTLFSIDGAHALPDLSALRVSQPLSYADCNQTHFSGA